MIVVVVGLVSAAAGPAATPDAFAWNSPVAGNWSDRAKWTSGQTKGVAPVAAGRVDYALGFNQAGTYTVNHDLNAGFLLNKLVFGGATVTIEGNSLAFAANGAALPQIIQNGGSAVTIKAPISLNGNTTCAGTGTGGAFTLAGVISGPGSLTIDAAGYGLKLLADNTYSGGTMIQAGSIQVEKVNSPLGTGPVKVNSGATLNLNGNDNLTNAFLLNGAKVVNGNSFSANLNGPVVLAATSTIDLTTTGNMCISGIVSGPGGLTKEGTAGPLQIFGANTFAGTVTVNAGSLLVTSLNSVSGGTPSSSLGTPTTVANGTIALGANNAPGTLIYSGPGETTDRVIKLAGTTGGLTINQAGTASGLPTTRGVSGLLKFTGNLSIPGSAGADNRKTLTLTHTMSSKTGPHVGQGEISGGIGDSVLGTAGQLATSVTKDGPGTWTLSGANTYTGATSVKAGTLAFTSAKSLGAGALDISTGAKVQLDFIGTRQIAALTFNAGTAQANGTYGSSLSLATNKDDGHFAGLGSVTVGPIASPATTTTLARTSGTSPCKAGMAVTFTVTVAGAAPTGNVIFYDGLKVIGTSPLNGSYQASLTTRTLAAAPHAITALYVGNAGNAPGASAALSQVVNETRAATTTALVSGANPSNFGAPVTFTATVTGKAPTGSVTFYDGTTVLGSAALNGTKASISTSSLAAGWCRISASYAGDAANRPSASTAVCFQTVNPPAGNGKLKVFILAGQSNMVGKGSVENGRDPNNLTGKAIPGGLGSLRHMLNANPQQYGYLADPAHPIAGGSPGWITRPDVWITYYGGASWELTEKKALRSGILEANFGENAKDGLIGPEYGFGLVVGSQLADQVLIIKYAHGGRSLGADFRPPSSGGTVGPCYTTGTSMARAISISAKAWAWP
ncbi:MAG: Ig-like domain repeat protein [Verrucomicrobia bacterium]|nr:Ig-like domain repeat protein [Verrucomicrobiota bacterium]